jgi:hypothetical protein
MGALPPRPMIVPSWTNDRANGHLAARLRRSRENQRLAM